MTARATFTEAEIARVIRAANKLGKVAFVTKTGIALVDLASLPLPSQEAARGNSCDEAFGTVS